MKPPPSTAVADVLALWGRSGWLSPPLRRFSPGAALGMARTVALAPGGGGFGPLYELLSTDLTGGVVVVSSPHDDAGVWGGLLTAAAARAGALAVVVAGAVRDLAELDLPTWARASATVGPAGLLEVAAVGAPVEIGGVTVADGDTVLVDDDGVALPADDVLTAAAEYAAAEQRVADALAAGAPLTEAIRHKTDWVSRFRA